MRGVRPIVTMLCGAAFAACARGPDREHVEALFLLDARRVPPPAPAPADVARGETLFRGLCSRCHPLDRHGQDGQTTERRHGGARGPRNVPTVFDAARQVAHGWDGTVGDLAAMVRLELVQRCGHAEDETLPGAVQALAGYLTTQRSVGRWDRYVEGDDAALSAAEREGLRVFLETGCAACHGGRTLGGASSHKLGVAAPWPTPDRGRAAATGDPADAFVFKAPMLRRVAHTAPYLHDGSVDALPEMVRRMAWHELGKSLTAAQVDAVVKFLVAVGDVDANGR